MERGEASGAVGLENVGARRPVHDELGSPAVMAAGGLGMGVARRGSWGRFIGGVGEGGRTGEGAARAGREARV